MPRSNSISLPTEASQEKGIFKWFAIILLASIFAGIITELWLLAAIPAGLLLAYITIVDFRKIFYLLAMVLPLSMEVDLPGGFGTDLPTEPLMLLLTGVYLFYVIKNGLKMRRDFAMHPFTLLIFAHIAWIGITTLTSEIPFISLKYFLAKIWYTTTFYFLASHIIKTRADFVKLFVVILIPLIFSIITVHYQHSLYQFSFQDVNRAMKPFYRNKVNYACHLSLIIPFVFLAINWQKRFSFKWWMLAFIAIYILIAIQLSYTRAAYVALIGGLGMIWVVKYKLTKHAVGFSLIGIILAVSFFIKNDKYIEFAPDFKTTVSYNNFDNLIKGTVQGTDISSMERVYRWVAGIHMIKERPMTGFGPSNFYENYQSYAVTSFKTYVSDNEEKSGIHSYYLMTLVEQGFPGLIIIFAMVFFTLIRAERIYHETLDPKDKQIILTIISSFLIISILCIINDMLEVDKVGPFFFMWMAFLINFDLKNQRALAAEQKS